MPPQLPLGLPKVLSRWLELDRRLASSVVNIRRFAEEQGVDERTVQRDLDMFRALGHRTEVVVVDLDGVREWLHRWPEGASPVFTRHADRG
jgi:hypothetical protein